MLPTSLSIDTRIEVAHSVERRVLLLKFGLGSKDERDGNLTGHFSRCSGSRYDVAIMPDSRGGITDLAFSLARVIIALLFACHGAQKLFGILGGTSQLGHTKMMIAGIIEFGGGLLIAFGLFTRIAAFIACGEMAVAYFTVHAPHSFWPIVNKGELAVAFCFFFLFVIAHGAGPYSLDRLLRRKL